MKKTLLLSLMAIIVPLVFFTMFGCMKKPEHKADYGPEVPVVEVQSALESLGRPDPYHIKKGQFAYYSYDRSIDTSAPQVLQQTANTVVDRVEDSAMITYTVVTKGTAFEDGVYKPIDPSSSNIIVDKPTASSTKSFFKPMDLIDTFGSALYSKSTQALRPKSVKITYHNLTNEKIHIPTPDLVKVRADCGGLTAIHGTCPEYLNAVRVTFDKVQWNDETKGLKRHYQIITSPEIPTVLAMTPDGPTASIDYQFCIQHWLDLQGRTVPVSDCDTLKDFTFSNE